MYNFENFLKYLKKNKNINKIEIDTLSNKQIVQNNKILLNIIRSGYNEANDNELSPTNQYFNNGINGNSFTSIPIQFRKEIIYIYNYCSQYYFKIDKRIFNIYINKSSSFFNDKLIIKKFIIYYSFLIVLLRKISVVK